LQANTSPAESRILEERRIKSREFDHCVVHYHLIDPQNATDLRDGYQLLNPDDASASSTLAE
jgi:hypothetical protein